MSIVDTLFFVFDLDAKKLQDGLSRLNQDVDGSAAKLGALDGVAKSLVEKGAGLLKVGSAFAALAGLAWSVSNLAAENYELQKLADRLGESVESVDDFIDSADLIGVGADEAKASLLDLNRAVEGLAIGVGKGGKIFEELGISLKDASGQTKSTLTILSELRAKMADLDQGRKVTIMERLGLDPELLRLFSADMDALADRMSRVDAAAGFDFGRAMKSSAEYTKTNRALMVEVNTLIALFQKFRDAFAIKAMERMTAVTKIATERLGQMVDFLLRHGPLVEGAIIGIGAAIMTYLVPAAIRGAIAVAAMAWPFILIGGAIAGAIALFAAIYDDVQNFLAGNKSVIGELSKDWPMLGATIREFAAEVGFMVDFVGAALKLLVDLISDPSKAWDNFISAIGAGVDKAESKMPKLGAALRTIGAVIKATGDQIMWVFDRISAGFDMISRGWQEVMRINKAVDNFFGAGEAPAMLTTAKQQLAVAGNSQLSSISSGAILAAGNTSKSKSVAMSISELKVYTQATDAEGIASAFGGALNTQLRGVAEHFDDGIDY